MKKALKIIGFTLLFLVLITVGFGIYLYQTNDLLRASINNDESKLYYFPSKEIEDLSDFNTEEVTLTVEDSISVYHYLFSPNSDSLVGNIFFIHGAGGNATTYKELIRPLVETGFRVYATDWRGYGKSDGTPNYKNVWKDTEAAFADFLSRTTADSLKTIVYGMSLGGQVAVKLTREYESKIDALVLDGSVASAQQLAIDYAPIAFLKEDARAHPEKFNQDYVAEKDISMTEGTPKLIIHSKNDQEVAFSHGKTLFQNALEPKSFWQTDTKHIMTLSEYPEEAIERIKSLLE